MNREIFVENVKYFCKKKGVKPTVACEESGAGKSLLSNLQNRGTVPSIEKVEALAAYLDVTVGDLIGEKTPTPGKVSGRIQPMNEQEQELIRIARGLDPAHQDMLLRIAAAVAYQDVSRTVQVPAGVPSP